MKKIVFLFIIILLGICVYAGTNIVISQRNLPLDKLINNISKTQDEVFTDLKLVEGKNITKTNELGGISYKYYKKLSLYGNDFSNFYLLFYNDSMYGFDYENHYTKQTENAFNLARKVCTKLTSQYGQPTTYPGLPNRVTAISNVDSLKNDKSSDHHYYEQWKVNDKILVYLNFDYFPNEDNSRLYIQYKINPDVLQDKSIKP